MSTYRHLFTPATVGHLALPHRFVMAPMTRNRALPSLVPGPQAAVYYAQRASAGLIITEATQVSDSAAGYVFTPGIYSPEQIAGWRDGDRRRACRRRPHRAADVAHRAHLARGDAA